MLYKKFQFVAQIVGFVTIGLLAVYGLVSILGGGTALAAALGQTSANTPNAVSPSTFNYQGLLRNSDGSLTTGTYTITARIYDVATGGSALYTETYPNVNVRDGLFNVVLGDNPQGQNLQNVFSVMPRYVGITLANGSELIPRQRVHGVPWALYATNASQATDFTASGNITATNISANGNIAAANFSASGNIAAANFSANGNISWTGHLMDMKIGLVYEIDTTTTNSVWLPGDPLKSICWLTRENLSGSGGCQIQLESGGRRLWAFAIPPGAVTYCAANCLSW